MSKRGVRDESIGERRSESIGVKERWHGGGRDKKTLEQETRVRVCVTREAFY